MDIVALNTAIKENTLNNNLLIFQYKDNDFLCQQYMRAIAQIKNKTINYINDVNVLLSDYNDLFFELEEDNVLNVLNVDELTYNAGDLRDSTDTIVITKKVSVSYLSEYTIVFPELEDWHIADYAYSIAEGVSIKDLDWIISICNKDINRIDLELARFSIFKENERKHLFNLFYNDGIYDDLTNFNTFNFTNAIIQRDKKAIREIYPKLKNIDINDFGLITLLYNNFRNIIGVQLSRNATPESLGLSPKQFNALKYYSINHYSADELVRAFTLIGELDRKIKSGEFSSEFVVDYILTQIV